MSYYLESQDTQDFAKMTFFFKNVLYTSNKAFSKTLK